MTGLPCPNCGSELALLEEYQRYYCYSCGQYAPEGYGDRGAMICPSCGGILSYVAQYDRYYCYRCGAYAPEDAPLQSIQETAPTAPQSEAASSEAPVAVAEPAKTEEPAATSVEGVQKSSFLPEGLVEEIPSEEAPAQPARPPLVREEILWAKKMALLDLCKAYDLEPTGTKEQLRERLLSYLDELETGARREEIPEGTVAETEAGHRGATQEVEPASAPAAEIAEEQPVAKEAPKEEPARSTARLDDRAARETYRASGSPGETIPEAVVVPIAEREPAVAVTPTIEPMKAAHPCPTCDRELTYVPLYRRWYCYNCRAYAPLGESQFACPNCGASLRWIGQYERWWCDACRRYAPSDLPKPEFAAVEAEAPVEVTMPAFRVAASPSTTFVHRHRSPGSGIGLVGFGVFLFLLYEILVDLPAVLSFDTGIVVAPDLAFGLRFFAFVFVAIGAIMGLSAVRDRR